MSGFPVRFPISAVTSGLAVVLATGPAAAIDGTLGAASAPSYYEQQLAGAPLSTLETSGGGLPSQLHLVDAQGVAEYRVVSADEEAVHWEVSLEVTERNHETVDAVYDLVLALPLPTGSDGGDAFSIGQWGIPVREGTAATSVPFIYGGEKLVLKRNVALEKMWLPALVGGANGLPDLSGTGYVHTLWDAIVRYDPLHGDRVQAFGRLRYATDAGVAAPDADDPRHAIHVITWIPTLDPTIAPFTIRLDVRDPAP